MKFESNPISDEIIPFEKVLRLLREMGRSAGTDKFTGCLLTVTFKRDSLSMLFYEVSGDNVESPLVKLLLDQ